jgi:hypothetical protein
MKLPPALFALLLAVPLACDSGDDSNDDEAADTSESGESDTASDNGGPEDFPPVECGDVTCVEGQVCVLPPETCDYDQDPPVWVQDPPVCGDVPMNCYGLVDLALNECLDAALCNGGEEGQFASLMNGTLDCPANGADCF